MSKSVIVITSHLNTEEKVDVMYRQINSLKNYTNIPILHASNFTVEDSIQKKFDYTVIKKNELSNRYSVSWQIINEGHKYKNYKLLKKVHDHGFPHLDLMLYAFKICESLNFDYVYHINYDCLFDENNFKTFINNGIKKEPKFYKYKLVNNDIRITTQVFSIKTKEFISALEPKISLYKNGVNKTDFNLKEGWLCEEFFEWVFNGYYGFKVKDSNIDYEDLIMNGPPNELNINKIKLTYYYDHINDEIIYTKSNDINYDSDIELTNEKGDKTTLKKYSDNIFYSSFIEGKIYYKNKLLTNIDKNKIKNEFFINKVNNE